MFNKCTPNMKVNQLFSYNKCEYKIEAMLGQRQYISTYKAINVINPQDIIVLKIIRKNSIEKAQSNLSQIPGTISKVSNLLPILNIRNINHPNILPILDVLQNTIYFVLIYEYVPTIQEALQQVQMQQSLLPSQIYQLKLNLLVDCLLALKRIHNSSTVHSSIKLSNIHLKRGPNANDFVALIANPAPKVNNTHYSGQNIAYLPPNNIQNQQYSLSQDVYALGICFLKLFTNRLFWFPLEENDETGQKFQKYDDQVLYGVKEILNNLTHEDEQVREEYLEKFLQSKDQVVRRRVKRAESCKKMEIDQLIIKQIGDASGLIIDVDDKEICKKDETKIVNQGKEIAQKEFNVNSEKHCEQMKEKQKFEVIQKQQNENSVQDIKRKKEIFQKPTNQQQEIKLNEHVKTKKWKRQLVNRKCKGDIVVKYE